MPSRWRSSTPAWICVAISKHFLNLSLCNVLLHTVTNAKPLSAPAQLPTPLRWLKPLLFGLCLLPCAWYVWGLTHTESRLLGADPVEGAIRGLGLWAFKLLLITLAVTPLRRLTGWHLLIRLRRMLGLFTFFYAMLHLSLYLVLDRSLELDEIARDVMKRPFITVGLAAFLILLTLAITSRDAMVRRLGGQNWRRLHRWVYAAAILVTLHYLWMVKADLRPPLAYGTVVAVLLGMRLWWYWRGRAMARAMTAARAPAQSGSARQP